MDGKRREKFLAAWETDTSGLSAGQVNSGADSSRHLEKKQTRKSNFSKNWFLKAKWQTWKDT